MPLDTIALYVHIPFCTIKCDYCDFFSCTNVPEDTQNEVVQEILLQGEYLLNQLGNPRVETIFIGGGTPTALPDKTLDFLVTGLRHISGENCSEFTAEINPESVTDENLNILKDGEVTRLSLGVQSFCSRLLTVIGRNTTEIINRNALQRIKSVWEKDLSIDLITEIPGQSEEDLINDLKTALSFSPDHLSLYALHIEEGTPLFNRMQGKDLRAFTYAPTDLVTGYLHQHTFERYEVSNYSLPGKECRHNLTYWHMKPYLGLGPGGVSTIPGETGIARSTTAPVLGRFLKGKASAWGQETVQISPGEFLTEYLMMGLRLTEGISVSRTEHLFGLNLFEIFGTIIEDWIIKGYSIPSRERLALTPKGLDLLNPLLIELMAVCDTLSLEKVNWP